MHKWLDRQSALKVMTRRFVAKEHQERIQTYTLDINSLHSRYNELGEQKKVLMDQLMELTKA